MYGWTLRGVLCVNTEMIVDRSESENIMCKSNKGKEEVHLLQMWTLI